MSNFDTFIDRRGTNSIKWHKYPPDILPLWVADMDFAAPEPIQAALQGAVDHAVFGYEFPGRELLETVAGRMHRLYGWQVNPEWVVATPGVVAGFTIAAHTLCAQGQGILIQPPVYPPFLKVHETGDWVRQDAPLGLSTQGSILQYGVDLDGFEAAIHSAGAKTGMFLLCNPHNPTGQAYAKDDLLRMAELCLEKDVAICSDEIHSELLLDEAVHTPIAALDPQIADHTITLIAPSKTFNVPGLFCGFAIIPNQNLLERYKKSIERMAMHVNSLGLVAAQAAFSGACDAWLAELRAYLTGNRNFLVDFIQKEMPGMRTTFPQATYLAWLDCTGLIRSGQTNHSPYEFFLEHARVALNEGREFGSGGEGFVRLNFGCPRATLADALERIKLATRSLGTYPENRVEPIF
jgi:cysteine-S-conjugate beta-lyase